MDDEELLARLRRGYQKPDGAKRRPSPRELEAADRIEALTARLAKAEALAEALRTAMSDGYDDEGNPAHWLDDATAALKAWEEPTSPAPPAAG